jgi:hypothetical protein
MKIVLLYLVLVGTPVAGIYGVVCLGQDLKPPMSVGGEWTVELTPRKADMLLCKGFIVSSESLILKVTQTGPHLALTLNDPSATQLSGEVTFERVTAKSLEEKTSSAPGIYLQANIHRQPGLDRLSGTFTFANCPAGSELSFTAIRRQKDAGGGH